MKHRVLLAAARRGLESCHSPFPFRIVAAAWRDDPSAGRLGRVLTPWLSALLLLAAWQPGLRAAAPPGSAPPRTRPDEAGTGSVQITPAYINSVAERLMDARPSVRAALERSKAAAAARSAVPTWEDPTLMIGGMLADRHMRAEDGDLAYGVEQELPLFGRPAAERGLAGARASVAAAEADLEFQFARRDLAIALFRAALADRVVEIGRQDLAWIDAILGTTESRYRIGEVPQSQVLRLQNERAIAADRLETDRRLAEQARAVLRRLAGETNSSSWPRFELPPPAGRIEFDERLVRLATASEPRVLVLHRAVEAAEAGITVARKSRLPQVRVAASAWHDSRRGDFRQAEVQVALTLPWFNARRHRSEIRRAEAERAAAEFDVTEARNFVREEVHGLVVRADAARREALLLRDEIIPRSEAALGSAEGAWISSRATFLEVLDARRALLDARLRYARAVAEQYAALSELVLCCGLADLEALEMLGAQPDLTEPAP